MGPLYWLAQKWSRQQTQWLERHLLQPTADAALVRGACMTALWHPFQHVSGPVLLWFPCTVDRWIKGPKSTCETCKVYAAETKHQSQTKLFQPTWELSSHTKLFPPCLWTLVARELSSNLPANFDSHRTVSNLPVNFGSKGNCIICLWIW